MTYEERIKEIDRLLAHVVTSDQKLKLEIKKRTLKELKEEEMEK